MLPVIIFGLMLGLIGIIIVDESKRTCKTEWGRILGVVVGAIFIAGFVTISWAWSLGFF